MGKALLPHNKRNCYPPYPDHYLNENVVAVDTKYPKFPQIIAIGVNLKNLIYS